MASTDIGIDLGTRTCLVYSSARGMVLTEPSVVVYDRERERIRAVGEEAVSMSGRLLPDQEVIWPIREGVISDYIVLEKMLGLFISRAIGRHSFMKPRISICVPSTITPIGRKALEESAYQSGARKVYLVEAPIACAIGAGLDISRPFGNLVVDIGAGSSDAAVLSMTGVVVSATIRTSSDSFNKAILSYIREKHNLFIGEDLAEKIKIGIGSACEEPSSRTMEVKGRNMITGLPKTITLTSGEISDALREPAGQIADMIHGILEKTPPELAADIVDRGIILTGGGALLRGMDRLVEQRTGVGTTTVQNAMQVAAIGTGRYAEVIADR